MATSEVVAGLVGAALGAGSAVAAPWLTERIRRKAAGRSRGLEALAKLRTSSRLAIEQTETAMEQLFDNAGRDASLSWPDVAGGFCEQAHLAIHGIDAKSVRALHDSATRLNHLIHQTWARLDEVSRFRLLLPREVRSRFDAQSRRELEARVEAMKQAREDLKVHLRHAAGRLGGTFPDSLVEKFSSDLELRIRGR